MTISNYPNGFLNGVTIRGVPLLQLHPGKVFWVNNSSVLAEGGSGGSDGSPGTYTQPFASVTYALTKCTASRGDIIAIMPGYTEAVSSAGGEAWNVAGVAIVGLGQGDLKPTFTVGGGTTSDTLDVSAANISVSNIRFVSSVDNLAVMVDVLAAGTYASFDRCEWMVSLAATGADILLQTTDGAFGFSVTNCTFNSESSILGVAVTSIPTEAIRLVHVDNAVVNDNFIVGNFSTAAINAITVASEAIQINRNYIHNVDTAAVAGGIDLVAACTGHVSKNNVGSYEVTTIDTMIDNASCSVCDNHIINVVTEDSDVGGQIST